MLEALDRLRTSVDLLLCDGHGLAHPRRCGVACHLGVVTGLPAVGCAKNHFVGEHRMPGPRRGDRSPLVDNGDVVGEVLRSYNGVRPVYVSPGHRIGIVQSTELVLALCSAYRLPTRCGTPTASRGRPCGNPGRDTAEFRRSGPQFPSGS